MYRYDEFDDDFVARRVETFRDQVRRRLSGDLTEEEFKPLRLQNGLYLQLHAYMLRVAIPYGSLNSAQMRQLAKIADRWDRGTGHFTTRQNIQFNWISLIDTPDILAALAEVGMHAIQTSGNCIRNVVADHLAGAADDEIEDPRPTAELLRQWSTDHPEFSFLPRKFKIAVSGGQVDRAATRIHDIGLRIVKNASDQIGYKVYAGGGLGRAPVVAELVREYLPKDQLLPFIQAILRVYNIEGRRDNLHKARIKFLIKSIGIDSFRNKVEETFASLLQHNGDRALVAPAEFQRIQNHFRTPTFFPPGDRQAYHDATNTDPGFRRWTETNLHAHKAPGYTIVTISLKPPGGVPGDADSRQMRAIADLAETYGHDELRISQDQNVILPHVQIEHLPAIYEVLRSHDLHSANGGQITDIVACPGMDYCSLATARSIPVSQALSKHFSDSVRVGKIGDFRIKVSGCINSCAHHHVADIGILGLEKSGRESYQITLGGHSAEDLTIGERAGPGVEADEVVPAVERLVDAYLALRDGPDESFRTTYRRLGQAPFKSVLYSEKKGRHVA